MVFLRGDCRGLWRRIGSTECHSSCSCKYLVSWGEMLWSEHWNLPEKRAKTQNSKEETLWDLDEVLCNNIQKCSFSFKLDSDNKMQLSKSEVVCLQPKRRTSWVHSAGDKMEKYAVIPKEGDGLGCEGCELSCWPRRLLWSLDLGDGAPFPAKLPCHNTADHLSL